MKVILPLIASILISACSRDIPQLKALKSFQFLATSLLEADISDDASILALLSVDTISVWSIETRELIQRWELETLKGHQYFVSLSKNKQFVASADKNKVTIFDLRTKEIKSTWNINGFSSLSKITSLKLNDDGKKIFIGLNEGTIVQIDLNNNTKSLFKMHSSNVSFLELAENGKYVLSASVDGSVILFNTSTGNKLSSVQANTRITSLVLDYQSSQFFYSDALNKHQVIDLKNSTVISSLNYFERFKYFRKGIFINEGKKLFNSTPKNQLAIWDIKTGKQVQKGNIKSLSFGSTVLDVALKENNDVLTISSDGIIETWHISENSQI